MDYPQVQETLDINIGAGQSTSSRTHADQHNDENRILMAIMQKVGIDFSLDNYSHERKINNIMTMLGITPGTGITNYNVGCVFDDAGNDLPITTATLIDGVTVTDSMFVYVLHCSDAGKVGKIYQAHVTGVNITWTYSYTPSVGDTITVGGGTIYGGNTFVTNVGGGITTNIYGTTGLKAITLTGFAPNFGLTVAGFTGYSDNDVLLIAANDTSGANPTLTINGLTAKTIVTATGLVSGQVYLIAYKGGQWILVAGAGGGGGLSAVSHDATLSGDGTPGDPLSVIGGGGGGAVTYEIFSGTLTGTTPVDITDIRIDVDTPYNIYYETQPAGIITRTTIGGKITLVSDNAGDTMDFRIVAFGFGSNSGYATGNDTLTGAGPWVINDSRITPDTPVNIYPDTNVVGYLTAVAGVGTITITSTATEVGTIVKWIAFTTTNNNPVSDEAYGPTWDGVTDEAPSKNAVYDKIESVSGGINTTTFLFQNDYSPYQINYFRDGREFGGGRHIVKGQTDNFNFFAFTRYNTNTNATTYGICRYDDKIYYEGSATLVGTKIGATFYNDAGYFTRRDGLPYVVYLAKYAITSLNTMGPWIDNYPVSGYTLFSDGTHHDSPVGSYNGYLYIRRTGTSDVRRFTDSGTALVYVDTITLGWIPTDLIVNDLGYIDISTNTVLRSHADESVLFTHPLKGYTFTKNSIYDRQELYIGYAGIYTSSCVANKIL